jgi:hypothetical protein
MNDGLERIWKEAVVAFAQCVSEIGLRKTTIFSFRMAGVPVEI